MTAAERLLFLFFLFFCTVAQDCLERIETHPESLTLLDQAMKEIFFPHNDSVENCKEQPGPEILEGW